MRRMLVETDDLIDSGEVAAILGLASHRAVSVYRDRYPDFPVPVVEKKSGGRCTLWLRQDVQRWRSSTDADPPEAS